MSISDSMDAVELPKGCQSFRRYNLDIQLVLFLLFFILCYLSDTFSSSFVAALATANARIASLEAELNASQKAYDVAAAAKANTEKSQKSALGKAKKAEKLLADANKEHAQREQAVAERLQTMYAAAESKYLALSSLFDFCCIVALADTCFLFFSFMQDLPGYLRRPCKRTMTL
jgi:hypothetical protein